jgi:hypothetical protein
MKPTEACETREKLSESEEEQLKAIEELSESEEEQLERERD